MAGRFEAEFIFRDRYPERSAIYERFDTESAKIRAAFPALLNLSYGTHSRARFDLFSGSKCGPLVVFIHGGYWQSLMKERYSFVAGPLLDCGMSVALPNYPLAPEASIAEMAGCIRQSILAAFSKLAARRIEPESWVLTGHSAGGHLAALVARDPPDGLPPLAGVVPVSGIFDVIPVAQTSLNAALDLDTAAARAVSPLHLPAPATRLDAVVGEAETSEFIRQAHDFVQYCGETDQRAARLTEVPDANHYSILLNFMVPRSIILDCIVRLSRT